jgi:hypothetical protein
MPSTHLFSLVTLEGSAIQVTGTAQVREPLLNVVSLQNKIKIIINITKGNYLVGFIFC